MEWKKEQLSTAELERRRQEYLRAAMSMMKRSQPPEQKNEAVERAPETDITVSASSDENRMIVPESGGIDLPEQNEEKNEEKYEEIHEENEETEETSEEKQENEASADDKYGVYTADELMSGEYSGDGLKKAAEILEEMTKTAEMMKKIANEEESDGDTTDFPDFSGDTDEEDEGIFREECTPEEDAQPEQPE